jgi:uncharacterized membrane protein
MTAIAPNTMYHRWLGWHAAALRRLAVATTIGFVVLVALVPFVRWQIALLCGWDASALVFLVAVWRIIFQADGPRTEHLATREDESRGTAGLLLVLASAASVLAVGFLLGLAGRSHGGMRVLYIAIGTLTVILSWTVVNTVFTLRYADRYFETLPEAVDFENVEQDQLPEYRDFAYLAFTIGMTYQVSDTTLRDRRIRRMVLLHALMSYVFGVVIVATGVNLVAGLVA